MIAEFLAAEGRSSQRVRGTVDFGWASGHCLCPACLAWDHPVWDPTADLEEILGDCYQRAFGSGAAKVREYFDTLEAARMAFVVEHGETDVFSFPTLYHEKFLAESEKRLAQAARVVLADSVEAKRIAFVAAGLTSTQMQIKNIDIMGRYWKTRDEGRVPDVISQWA
ncbi:MAG: hypothetical protein ACK53L_20635, partial [Pirellulaceae bacterium]